VYILFVFALQELLVSEYGAGLSMPQPVFEQGTNWALYLEKAAGLKRSWTIKPHHDCDTASIKILDILSDVASGCEGNTL
jgi:hypothetical protein